MIPYYDITSDDKVVRSVIAGTKLGCLQGCPKSVFETLMTPCWNLNATGRPNFVQLRQLLCTKQDELLMEEPITAEQGVYV
jgi:hypothetical protein